MCKCGSQHDHPEPLYAHGPSCDKIIRWHEKNGIQAGFYFWIDGMYPKPLLTAWCTVCKTSIIQGKIWQAKGAGYFGGNPWDLVSDPENRAMDEALRHHFECKPAEAKAGPVECTICMDNPINTALICGHCFCRRCIESSKICPTCREPITQRQHLFL